MRTKTSKKQDGGSEDKVGSYDYVLLHFFVSFFLAINALMKQFLSHST